MQGNSFFDESKERSQVKTRIVEKYFWSWATIMTRQAKRPKIGYVDLFAGPGKYEGGTSESLLCAIVFKGLKPRQDFYVVSQEAYIQ